MISSARLIRSTAAASQITSRPWWLNPAKKSTACASFSTSTNNTADVSADDASSPTTPPPQPTRPRALSLYRQLLRSAEKMPTPNRRNYVLTKTKAEYRKHKTLDPIKDAEEIEFQLRLADTNLDTVMVQAEHLTRLFNDPDYQNYN